MKLPSDPFVAEIEALASFGKFDQGCVKFCIEMYQKQDKKITSIYAAYLKTTDRDDFIHTINRFY